MVSSREIARVLYGLSLVAKEGIKSVQLETAIKAAVLSVADVAGLTKGKLRQIHSTHTDTATGTGTGTGTDSVIFFTDHVPAPNSDPPHTSVADATVLLKFDSQSSVDVYPLTSNDATAVVNPQTSVDVCPSSSGAPSTSNDATAAVTPLKQRKPRERRVPSTPFSRAMG